MNLTPEQYGIVACPDRRVFVEACPGAGKTALLIAEASAALAAGEPPESISLVTFSRRAALELKNRLQRSAGPHADGVHVGTIHGLCFMAVAKLARKFGYADDRLVMVSKRDRKELIRQVLSAMGGSTSFVMRKLEQYGSNPQVAADAVVQGYMNLLVKENAVDYTILVRMALRPEVLDELRPRCRHLLVDEAQDADAVQLELYDKLAPDRLLMVADPRQTIYEWRGADPKAIEAFAATCTRKALSVNFRSTEPIIAAVNRFAKTIGPHAPMVAAPSWGGGPAVSVVSESEAAAVEPEDGQSIAFLARTNYMLDEWASRLDAAGTKHTVVGRSERLIDEPSVSEALAWLAWPDMPNAGLLLDRALSGAVKSIDRSKMRAEAREQGITLFERAMKLPLVAGFYADWDQHNLMQKVTKAFRTIGSDARFTFEAILTLLVRFTNQAPQKVWTGGNFVNWLATLDAQDEAATAPGIQMMTIHAAKGLEFDAVYIVGLGDRELPWRGDDADNMLEERRLMYVAMTRAGSRLSLVRPPGHVDVSRFVGECVQPQEGSRT